MATKKTTVVRMKGKNGRPMEVPNGVRVTIHITQEQRAHAEIVGAGNLSRGLRDLLNRTILEDTDQPI